MKVDYLVVGQGLAGTHICHQLQQRGKSFTVIDKGIEGTSSDIAAGVINPVTGHRYVKSWMVDQLLESAHTIYNQFEKLLNAKLIYDQNIIRIIFNDIHQKNWEKIHFNPAIEKYLVEKSTLGGYEDLIHPVLNYGELKGSLRIDVSLLIRSYRAYLQRENLIKEEAFDLDDLDIQDKIIYKGIKSENIIFCVGSAIPQKSLFSFLPFTLAKGEVVNLKINKIQPQKMLRHKSFLVPLGDQNYWTGGGYEWEFKDTLPSQSFMKNWKKSMDLTLKVPYQILNHKAAVRPCAEDRRPFLGTHPIYPNIHIFNGLGTKGTSLSPYWSKHLIDHLENGIELNKEVDIKRCLT